MHGSSDDKAFKPAAQYGKSVTREDPPSDAPDASGAGLSGEMLQRGLAMAEKYEWQLSGQISPVEDEYFANLSKPDGYRWFWKPLAFTIVCGLAMLICFCGYVFLRPLDAALGNPLGGYVELSRAILLFSGFGMLMIGSPLYRPVDWTPEYDAKTMRDREAFKLKRRL
jgi:hypothetical protein